ncbi:MAG: hypothetical protein PVI15_09045 [Chromatiales bacterium]
MAILLLAELAAAEPVTAGPPPDLELLEFLGGWAPEDLDWMEAILEEEGDADSSGPAEAERD